MTDIIRQGRPFCCVNYRNDKTRWLIKAESGEEKFQCTVRCGVAEMSEILFTEEVYFKIKKSFCKYYFKILNSSLTF